MFPSLSLTIPRLCACALAALALLLYAIEANACHRYAVWHYPTPQRCGVFARVDRSWTVEITRLPTAWADDGRADAIKQLRGLMK